MRLAWSQDERHRASEAVGDHAGLGAIPATRAPQRVTLVPLSLRPPFRAAPAAFGSVRARASKYSLCSRTGGNVPSRGFQDGQHGRGPPEVEQSPAIGGNMLMVAGAE